MSVFKGDETRDNGPMTPKGLGSNPTVRDVLAQHYGGFLNMDSAWVAADRAIRELGDRGFAFTQSGAVCKGDWLLGSACGGCARCLASAPSVINDLRKAKNAVEAKMASVTSLIPPPFEDRDYKDEVKVRMFDTLRKHLYDK